MLLREHGRNPGKILGAGMEGTVVDLPPHQVAKVWHDRLPTDLAPLLRFGTALGRASLPFQTSQPIELLERDGLTITIEEKMHGEPLRPDAAVDPPVASEEETRLMGDALAGLSTAAISGLGVLPVLPTEPPFNSERPFGTSLAELAERRFRHHPELLRREIDDIDELMAGLLRRLRELPTSDSISLVHGDLIPANVLVSKGEVAGIVDFGFLTTLGDPQFDAAITASIFDMYGTNARESEHLMSQAFVARFDHDRTRYALYRAAYAVITNSYFGPDGEDGHFAWCASILRREDIRTAVS